MNKYQIGVIQMDTRADKNDNLKRIENMIEQAVQQGVKLISLPEVMNVTSLDPEINKPEPIPGYTIDRMRDIAARCKVWIHCGSIRERNGDGNPYNTSIMLDPNGMIKARYRKLHLFDVNVEGGPVITESAMNSSGNEIVVIDTELGRLGFSLCYDIRFPELFRLMALEGAQVIFTPANFTRQTGEAHWEPLLRARAIENGCYIIASAQVGEKPRFTAYGHSMVIDPWGKIIEKARDCECLFLANIDLDYVSKIQNEIGSLKNRRTDIYSLERALAKNI